MTKPIISNAAQIVPGVFGSIGNQLDAISSKIDRIKVIKDIRDFKNNHGDAFIATAAAVTAVALLIISGSLSYIATALKLLAIGSVIYGLATIGKKHLPESYQQHLTDFGKKIENLFNRLINGKQAEDQNAETTEQSSEKNSIWQGLGSLVKRGVNKIDQSFDKLADNIDNESKK